MNLRLAQDVTKARLELEKMMGKMFDKEFSGLAPGTTFLKDDEFVRWYESQINGIPGPPQVDPNTGMQMPGWKSPPRPNFEQMLALAGEDGHEVLYRYSKLMGRHEQMKEYVMVVNWMAEQQRKKAG